MFDFTYMVRKPEVRSLYVNDLKIPYLTIAEGSYIVKGHFETYTNDCNILVGRYCSIAHDVTFLLSMNHDYNSVTTYSWDSGIYLNKFNVKSNPKHPKFNTNRRQIIIGNDVWIGRGVTIMGGVRIGNGAVIGAGAIVSKNIPPYSIVVGNPAKVIKYRFDSEIIRKLQAIRWWNWSTQKIVEEFSISDDPKTIIDRFYSKNLEIITKDSLGDHLRELKSRGFKIFSTIADFQAKLPLWKSIAAEFLKCKIDRAILCIHLRRDVSKDQMSDILKMIERSFNKKLIVALKSPDDRPFSLDSLRETDVFVTTCEDDCSKAIDAMSDLNFETRYIFDDLVFF